jgi:hypothetical protein
LTIDKTPNAINFSNHTAGAVLLYLTKFVGGRAWGGPAVSPQSSEGSCAGVCRNKSTI